MNILIALTEAFLIFYIGLGITAQCCRQQTRQKPLSLKPLTGDDKLFCAPEAWPTLTQLPRTELLRALREALFQLQDEYCAIAHLTVEGQQLAVGLGPTNLGRVRLTIVQSCQRKANVV
jgi:hypothetical protein